ncbi:hypothetical protein CJP74_00350 [Psittacicella melopsittaci]|uniref:type I site-specific deoxyribonuclease n=1 Tax=Psittacicella melopsittaci TaxID=2028576 RepID=A0A3A1Y8S3_9GAMM|nr:DEAD/DEAH box helicase family protein [Psittacicella melopsittaci]RIY34065.1 hypothetical protein CJP74_00350 [Psittacicella melopsittaci]
MNASEKDLCNEVIDKILSQLGYKKQQPSSLGKLAEQALQMRTFSLEQQKLARNILSSLLNSQSDFFASKQGQGYYLQLVNLALDYLELNFKQRTSQSTFLWYNYKFAQILQEIIALKAPHLHEFSFVREVKLPHEHGSYRADYGIYFNGILLSLIEVKRDTSLHDKAQNQLLNQSSSAPSVLFAQLLVALSENSLTYISAGENQFKKWVFDGSVKHDFIQERVKSQLKLLNLSSYKRLKENLTSLFSPYRLLDFVQSFILYHKVDASTQTIVKKISARHNQYYGACALRARIIKKYAPHLKEVKSNPDWQAYVKSLKSNCADDALINQAPGSGKSMIITFLLNWILKNLEQAKVIVVFDRVQLEQQYQKQYLEQLEQEYSQEQLVNLNAYRSKNMQHLQEQLDDPESKLIFTLIQKFNPDQRDKRVLDSYNCVVIVDECHRSHSGNLHHAIRQRLSDKQIILGLTGTASPEVYTKNYNNKFLRASESNFGDVVHTYSYAQSVNDGNIYDITYLYPVISLIKNDNSDLSDFADKSYSQIKNSLNREIKLTPEQSLDYIYAYVHKYLCQEQQWGALLVCEDINQAFHYAHLLEQRNLSLSKKQANSNLKPIPFALITSYSLNQGANQDPQHKESKEELLRRLIQQLDPNNSNNLKLYEQQALNLFQTNPEKLRLLIVVDKLTTGFDAPKAKLLFLARNLQGGQLIQTISRVNRYAQGKTTAYVADFCNNYDNLQKARVDYIWIPDQFKVSNSQGVNKKLEIYDQKANSLYLQLQDLGQKLGIDIQQENDEQLGLLQQKFAPIWDQPARLEPQLLEVLAPFTRGLKDAIQALTYLATMLYVRNNDLKQSTPLFRRLEFFNGLLKTCKEILCQASKNAQLLGFNPLLRVEINDAFEYAMLNLELGQVENLELASEQKEQVLLEQEQGGKLASGYVADLEQTLDLLIQQCQEELQELIGKGIRLNIKDLIKGYLLFAQLDPELVKQHIAFLASQYRNLGQEPPEKIEKVLNFSQYKFIAQYSDHDLDNEEFFQAVSEATRAWQNHFANNG